MFKSIAYLMLILGVGQCTVKQEPASPPPSPEKIEEMNRLAIKKESLQIDEYVRRMGWPVTTTGSGLRYYIYEKGSGATPKPDEVVEVRMIITLLNGDTSYSWHRYGSETFMVERSSNESGLHEAVQLMKVGDRAKIILPSHLAFGVAGDRNKIPPRSVVVYDLELLQVK